MMDNKTIIDAFRELITRRKRMSVEILTNSGMLGHDKLDEMRVAALIAAENVGGLPTPVVEYIQTLELSYIETQYKEKLKTFDMIKWKEKPDAR
jgi:hypothetical protein